MPGRFPVVLAVLALSASAALAQDGEMDPPPSVRTTSSGALAAPARGKDSTSHARTISIKPHVPAPPDSLYRDVDVDSVVILAPGSPTPAYPIALASAHIEGKVTARFVVGINGKVEPETIRIVTTTNAVLSKSVREALPTMRFEPAVLHGRPVRQVVEQPFTFTLP